MLTPHEIANLLVAAHSPHEVNLLDPDLAVLVARNLLRIESAAIDEECVRLTASGARVVARLGNMSLRAQQQRAR